MRETREGLGRGRAGDRARDGAGSLMGEPRLYSIPSTSWLRGGSRHSQLLWAVGWGGEKGCYRGSGAIFAFCLSGHAGPWPVNILFCM